MNGHMCRVSASSMPTCQNVIFFNLQDLNSEVCNLDKTDVPAPQRSCLEKSGWLSGNFHCVWKTLEFQMLVPDAQSSIFVSEIPNLLLSKG